MTTAVRTPGGLRASRGPRMTPGRGAVLAIGVPIVLAMIGWTCFSFVSGLGRASFPVSYPVPVQAHQVTVGTGGGDVTVRQVQAGQGRLDGIVQYSLFRPQVIRATTASGTSVGLHCRLVTGSCGLNATLDVPSGTAVRLNSGGGNVDVSGVRSRVTLTSDGGDVSISGIGGVTTVSTGGGNLTATNLGATLRFTTSGGDVNGNGLSSPVITTDSGGGNVTLVFTTPPSTLDITSSGGDVSVLLPHGGTAYDISSDTSGGDYRATVPTSSSSAHEITVHSGGGNVSIAEAS